jgi:hypothetical protein
MNLKMIVSAALAIGLFTGCECEKCEKGEKGEGKEASQSELLSQAKISKETAQQTAQAQVPNGTVNEAELEREKGKLIWSFGFTLPGTKDIKEVNIDAVTGTQVGDVETETPEDQAKEAAEDAAKEKKGDKEDKD